MSAPSSPLLDFQCTCQTPPTVDLTECYLSKHGNNGENLQQSPTDTATRTQLLNHFETWGWTLVSLNLSRLPKNTPLFQCQNHYMWKQDPQNTISKLFDPEFCASNPFPQATLRTAESGSAGESAVEPKQSWEIRRCSGLYDNANTATATTASVDNHKHNHLLQDITAAMHSIITTIQSTLELPQNLLVQQQRKVDHNNSYSCSCQLQEKQTVNPPCCNIDLLRVFYYDKVDSPSSSSTSNNTSPLLGSSPHTDWGTWTVVWQDHVGGLQTYCHACQKWNDVPAPTPHYNAIENNEKVSFVIHVGDATSLAMGCALQQFDGNSEDNHNTDPSENHFDKKKTTTTMPSYHWPSPKHRVLSPTTEPRASLVYFVYPPIGQSLASLSEGLMPWVQSQYCCPSKEDTTTARKVSTPYEEYFLLHDQSADDATGVKRSPKEVFNSIVKTPMEQVFAEKWNQVQRV